VVVLAPSDHSNDGDHSVEYRSTDKAGNVESVQTGQITIDTTAPGGGVTDPGTTLRGTVTLASTATDVDIASVGFQYKVGGGSTWTTIGTDTSTPWSVDWDTTTVADGAYGLRAIVTDRAGNATVTTLPTKVIDNTAPAGAIVAPAENATISGSVAITVAASDLTTGIASIQFRIKATGDADFTTIGSDSTEPYSTV